MNNISAVFFEFLSLIERKAAYAQGKGYGTSSIHQEVKLVHQLLSKQPILAIDIGANIGDYTAELRRSNHSLEIHTFEPSSSNILKLKERFSNDKFIILNPNAVSNESGSATLYSNVPGSGLSSLTKRKLDHFKIDFDCNESVHTLRFEDYWIGQLNKRSIDIAKIDIEGHELSALSGFGKAIHATKVFQFEFGGCNIDTKTYFQDFWYFFKFNEFDIYRITPFGLLRISAYKETDEFFSTTSFIAVNRKF